jgi:hypothetical protein
VQNPSFETGLTYWQTDNVTTADEPPFEGTQVASLGPGVASMFQDFALASQGNYPLFLSFNVLSSSNDFSHGNLIAEILWLDKNQNTIATGLSVVIPTGQLHNRAMLNFFDISDRPPAGTAWARLQFSKGAGTSADFIIIDQVILIPVDTINLVQNPSFELGLFAWNTNSFSHSFSKPMEGSAHALGYGRNSILFQDVALAGLPAHSSFLLSFGTAADLEASLSVQILWLDAHDNQIGSPGLNLFIPELTLSVQQNYLTYLDISEPAPKGAIKARIQFNADVGEDTNLFIDQVILTKTATPNLVQNSSFTDGLNNWTSLATTVVTSSETYDGNEVARLSDYGGMLFQDIHIPYLPGHCFLLNFSLDFRTGENLFPGNTVARVIWLNSNGKEIGLGLSLMVPGFVPANNQWRVYTGITEPAPPGAASVRIQFTKSVGYNDSFLDIDKVVLSRLV